MPQRMLPNLPESFRDLFWDVDFRPTLGRRRPEFVVERLLEHGGDSSMRWLLRNAPRDLLERVVRTSRRLRRPTACCWANYLDIPTEEIECLKRPSLLSNSSFA